MKQYMSEGRLEPKLVLDLMWNVMLFSAQRWGGNPDEQILANCKQAEARARRSQRDALQEVSMMRQHLKKLEKKYKESCQNVKMLSAANLTAQNQLRAVNA